MHKRLYLETSIINFVFADDTPDKRDVTLSLFKLLSGNAMLEGYVSSLVIDEIMQSPEDTAKKLIDVVNSNNLEVIEMIEEATVLGDKYIEEGIIPEKYSNDAYHIAIASVESMHAIISWNFKHIVKMKTIEGVQGINLLMGYQPIKIYSPLEVVGDD